MIIYFPKCFVVLDLNNKPLNSSFEKIKTSIDETLDHKGNLLHIFAVLNRCIPLFSIK
jgi:hypothetical protein